MKITPFKNMVLVRPLDNKATSSGILLTGSSTRFVRLIVLRVSSEIDWVKEGDLVIANPTPDNEVVNSEGDKLINVHDILAKEEEDGKQSN